jgi:hypothetical protein
MAVNALTEYLKGRKCEGFRSVPYVSKEGDFVTYFFEETECYAERADDRLTIYLAPGDDRLVGVKLKGIAQLQSSLASFKVLDAEGGLMLGMLFVAGGFWYAAATQLDRYRQLAEATKEVELPQEAALA